MAGKTKREKGQTLTLADLKPGMVGYVHGIRTNGLMRRRLVDLGFVPGTKVELVLQSPTGDPRAYRIRETQIALRKSDAQDIEIALHHESLMTPLISFQDNGDRSELQGTLQDDSSAHQLSHADGFYYIIALAGNPNTGKSTVFNALTGLHQHVGNWPGKTVSRAEGWWKYEQQSFQVVDLPGTYSLLSTSTDEEIARDFVLFGAPDCTVVVVDATCLERNLNLTLQILEITGRVVVCVNLIDEARRKGISIDHHLLEKELGVPVVPTVARSGEGIEQLKQRIFEIASGQMASHSRCMSYTPDLQKAIDELVPSIQKAFPDLPNAQWIAMRLIDGGDVRLRLEIENGVLADLAGRIGELSLPDHMHPDAQEISR